MTHSRDSYTHPQNERAFALMTQRIRVRWAYEIDPDAAHVETEKLFDQVVILHDAGALYNTLSGLAHFDPLPLLAISTLNTGAPMTTPPLLARAIAWVCCRANIVNTCDDHDILFDTLFAIAVCIDKLHMRSADDFSIDIDGELVGLHALFRRLVVQAISQQGAHAAFVHDVTGR